MAILNIANQIITNSFQLQSSNHVYKCHLFVLFQLYLSTVVMYFWSQCTMRWQFSTHLIDATRLLKQHIKYLNSYINSRWLPSNCHSIVIYLNDIFVKILRLACSFHINRTLRCSDSILKMYCLSPESHSIIPNYIHRIQFAVQKICTFLSKFGAKASRLLQKLVCVVLFYFSSCMFPTNSPLCKKWDCDRWFIKTITYT